MPQKRLLLFASTTGYQTRVFDETARRLGVDLVLATDRCNILDDPWGDHAIPVRFDVPEEADGLRAQYGKHSFDGILAVGDRPARLAALAAERLEIPFHPSEAAVLSSDKFLARERFQSAGLLVPSYRKLHLPVDITLAARQASYPCVLKPLGLSGSRGVIRANDENEFTAAIQRIEKILHDAGEDRSIQVEDYIEGREFALEGLVTSGRLQVLALFDKPDPLEGPYFEETIYVTPSQEDEQTQLDIISTTQAAVQALGLMHGPIHAEMRHNSKGTWMLEVAPRPIGGLCAKMLHFEPDIILEELIIRHALGDDVSQIRRRDAASGVMMIPIPKGGIYQGVTGIERASSVPGVWHLEITAKEGHKLEPLPEGSSYLGFIFAGADNSADVVAALKMAHSELSFEILGALPVLTPARSQERTT